MTSVRDISKATVGRISPALPQNWKRDWYEPVLIPVPGCCVFPRDPSADATRAQGNSSAARWFMTIGFYMAVPHLEAERAARDVMADLMDTEGPVMSLLRDRMIKDDLYGLVRRSIKFGMHRGLKTIHRNGDRILPGYVDFTCLSDR